MIIDRRVWTVKRGHMFEAAAVLKSMGELMIKHGYSGRSTIYYPASGAFDQLSAEAEYQSLADRERMMQTMMVVPEFLELNREWTELTTGGTMELWYAMD